ncbi:hypothetical protein [Cupriavidus gilardii]|nr:hypothetical protein QWJ31_16585 [Cupriavidus gilardii]
MDPAYWQTVAQWQQAEEELAEYMRWYEEHREQLCKGAATTLGVELSTV